MKQHNFFPKNYSAETNTLKIVPCRLKNYIQHNHSKINTVFPTKQLLFQRIDILIVNIKFTTMKFYTTLTLCLLGLSLNAQVPNAPVTVSVTDPDGAVIPNDKIVFIGQKTKKKIVGITNAKGKFLVQLPAGDTYDIKISAIGDDMDYNSVEIPTIPANAEFQDMEIAITYWMGDSFILSKLNFETGKSTIKSGSYASLDELADYLKRKKTLRILLGGHTDNVGSANENLTLSKSRALAVKAYLVKKGVSAGRVRTEGYGMNQPIADNTTASGRAKNRRTEVQIVE